MNKNTLNIVEQLITLTTVDIYQGTINSETDDSEYLINHSYRARQAFGCLLRPEPGDKVLFTLDEDNNGYILFILERQEQAGADLQLPGKRKLNIRAKWLHFIAEKDISATSLGTLNFSVLRNIHVNCSSYCSRVAGNLIQICKDAILRSENYSLDANKLLAMHGKHQILTAEQDMKIDAERINMG